MDCGFVQRKAGKKTGMGCILTLFLTKLLQVFGVPLWRGKLRDFARTA